MSDRHSPILILNLVVNKDGHDCLKYTLSFNISLLLVY